MTPNTCVILAALLTVAGDLLWVWERLLRPALSVSSVDACDEA
jgi:hypothetical protein